MTHKGWRVIKPQHTFILGMSALGLLMKSINFWQSYCPCLLTENSLHSISWKWFSRFWPKLHISTDIDNILLWIINRHFLSIFNRVSAFGYWNKWFPPTSPSLQKKKKQEQPQQKNKNKQKTGFVAHGGKISCRVCNAFIYYIFWYRNVP